MTTPDPLVLPDVPGYTITSQTSPGSTSVTYVVHRDADGTGLGAYADPAYLDEVIAADQAAVQAAAARTAELTAVDAGPAAGRSVDDVDGTQAVSADPGPAPSTSANPDDPA